MTTRDDNSEDAVETRIRNMKDRLATMAGGELVTWESNALTADEREHFWRIVIAFENRPFTTDFDRLTTAGIELPDPDSLNEPELRGSFGTGVRGSQRRWGQRIVPRRRLERSCGFVQSVAANVR